MLTFNEARDRVAAIWGLHVAATERIYPSYDRKHWYVEPDGHTLDENGHAVCHPECEKKEAAL